MLLPNYHCEQTKPESGGEAGCGRATSVDHLFICCSLNNPGLQGVPGLCRIKPFLPSLPLEEVLMGLMTLALLGKVLSIVRTVQRVFQFLASSVMGPGHQEIRYMEKLSLCVQESCAFCQSCCQELPFVNVAGRKNPCV